MHKEEVLFQPWAVWYCHNHLDKTVGNAKAIHSVTKDLAPPVPRPQKNAKLLDSSRGNMTNNQFSSLHAHSEIITLDKALRLRSITDRSNTS